MSCVSNTASSSLTERCQLREAVAGRLRQGTQRLGAGGAAAELRQRPGGQLRPPALGGPQSRGQVSSDSDAEPPPPQSGFRTNRIPSLPTWVSPEWVNCVSLLCPQL